MIRRVTGLVFLTGSIAAFGFGQEEELPVLVRSFAEAENPAPPFEDGKFVPRKGETIAFIGGTDTFNQQQHGFLEELIHLSWPDHELKIRNLGWQGDTIFHQARPRYFYTKRGDPQPDSSPDTRKRTEPGIIFINFGKMESLDDEENLPDFDSAYENLLDHLVTRTRRIVLIGPAPFFPAGPAAESAVSRNSALGLLVRVIRLNAERRDLVFVDAHSSFLPEPDPAHSTNGIHLSETGQRQFAEIVANQLKFPVTTTADDDRSALQSLRQSIQRRNRLWHQYYHPTNWAFLFGDRQHVPASRNYEDTKKRWFLKEVDALPSLIAESETDIFRYAREAAPRLP